ncbi:MAG: ATP-binding cassette domain-containing protein [Planctomycetota bacterium]|nr:ATP-binding cassette domain-containing protein [Planctomycetota bacterium]
MLKIKDLALQAGEFRVEVAAMEVAAGEYFVLLGPNGSGKTLLLSCLAGLLRAERGTVLVAGQDVTHVEPRRRNIGYVPQDYGLFPHMDVARNITFALRVRGMAHAAAMERLAPLIELLNLRRLLEHWPLTLSGGERQKAALARALAIRPSLLLLDEPVSALDWPTRAEVLEQLRRVQQELAVTTIHVCHSPDEALAVADRAGVMIGGRLAQAGRLEDLIAHPAGEEVARLLRPMPVAQSTRFMRKIP